jgi:hypothetical protein
VTRDPRGLRSTAHGELGSVIDGVLEAQHGHGTGHLTAVMQLMGQLAIPVTSAERLRGADHRTGVGSPVVLMAR